MYFTTENPRKIVTLIDDAPQWLKDAVRDAHQGDMPNDWIYAECAAAFDAIEEGLDEDNLHSHVDSQVDIYTKNLFQWAADMCLTSTYSEAEASMIEMCAPTDTLDRIRGTQYAAILYIDECMLRAWEANK